VENENAFRSGFRAQTHAGGASSELLEEIVVSRSSAMRERLPEERESPERDARSRHRRKFCRWLCELVEEELLVTLRVKHHIDGPVAAPSSPA